MTQLNAILNFGENYRTKNMPKKISMERTLNVGFALFQLGHVGRLIRVVGTITVIQNLIETKLLIIWQC